MARKSIATLIAVLLMASMHAWAADGVILYKEKCAGCHGANGEGKPAIKAPAVKGSTLEVDQIVERFTKGEPNSKAPHNKAISGLTGEQAEAIAEFIKTQ